MTGSGQPDQHEEGCVQQKADDAPQPLALHSGLGRCDVRRPKADVEAAGDSRQHTGEAEFLGREIRRVAGEERDGELSVDVVEGFADSSGEPAHRQTDRDAADNGKHELEAGVQ